MNNKNNAVYILMKEFDRNRENTRKMVEEHILWRTVPREIKALFYGAYDYVNGLSDKVIYKILENDEEFNYDSFEYLDFVNAEESLYDFIYYTLEKRYGIKNCLPY